MGKSGECAKQTLLGGCGGVNCRRVVEHQLIQAEDGESDREELVETHTAKELIPFGGTH